MNKTNIIVISDLHLGSSVGLWPPEYQSRDGKMTASVGRFTWPNDCWHHFWNDWVPSRIGRTGKYILIINGDIIEGNHHGCKQLITPNITEQTEAAIDMLKPVCHKSKCSSLYVLRGTETHVQDEEETIAGTLGAIRGGTEARAARYELWLRIHDVLIHATHHIGASNPFTDPYQLQRHLLASVIEYGRASWDIPKILLRGHRHRFGMVQDHTGMTSLATPSWKMADDFTYKVAAAGLVPQVGGVLLTVFENGEFQVTPKIYHGEAPRVEG